MKTFSFDLTFDQVELLMLQDAEFRKQCIAKLLNMEEVTLDKLVQQSIRDGEGNHIAAIKSLRQYYLDYPHLFEEVPHASSAGMITLHAAKDLILAGCEKA